MPCAASFCSTVPAMFLPKDSFCAQILNRKALGWLNFAHRAAACKQGPD
jgi:hypothetical protein